MDAEAQVRILIAIIITISHPLIFYNDVFNASYTFTKTGSPILRCCKYWQETNC